MPSARPGHHQRRQAAEESQKAQEDRARARVMDYRATFGTDSGQRVLADLLRRCRVLASSPDQFTEGSRAVGLHILELLTGDEEALTRFTITANTEDLYQ